MGLNTTITFRNDSYGEIENNPKEVLDVILKALRGEQKSRNKDYDCIGSHANPVIIQRPRHADETTLYLHAGNTLIDLAEAESEWAIDTAISEMKWHMKELLKKQKAIKEKKK